MSAKHPQFILAMLNSYFEQHKDFNQGLNRYLAAHWLTEVQSQLIIGQRELLETLPAYRQLLPYVIVRQKGKDGIVRYLPYQRTKKVGEQRLAGAVSVGYGGHIDLGDVIQQPGTSVIQLFETIHAAAIRELGEELCVMNGNERLYTPMLRAIVHDLGFTSFADQFILDNSNDVGKVHVGIVCVFDAPEGWGISCAEEELTTLEPMTAQELLKYDRIAGDFTLENWSRIYLEAQIQNGHQG